jgi:hypothetical protein
MVGTAAFALRASAALAHPTDLPYPQLRKYFFIMLPERRRRRVDARAMRE